MWDLPGPGIQLVSPALGTLYHREVPKYIHFKNMFWFVYKLFLWKLLSGKKMSNIFFLLINLFYFTILYWFCHTLTWIHHKCTCVPYSEPPTHLPLHHIPLDPPSAPAWSTLYHASNLDWRFISHMIFYMFQCHFPLSSHPRPLPQSPKGCSIHLCLFCCLAFRVIITFFLNSIYLHSVQFS